MSLYIKSIPSTVKHIVLYSDNCGGQNKNQHFASSIINAMNENTHLETIDHKFLERGHTHMEVDSLHAAVEHAKRHVPVFVPADWETVCRLARKHKRPYNVIPLTHESFFDFKMMSSQLPVVGKISWRGTCMIRYQRVQGENGSEVDVSVKDDFEKELTPIKPKKTRISSLTATNPPKPPKAYKGRLTISDSKKADLLALCKDGTIPAVYHRFYEQLPCDADIEDRIPETDDEENSDRDEG